jgi:uncharacterized protein
MSEVRDIFVDTVAWIALTNADDALHERAQQVMAELIRSRIRLVTTDLILLKVADALSAPEFRAVTISFVNGLRSNSSVYIVKGKRELLDAGWDLYCKRPDKEWGLTDCTSFAVMSREKLQVAFTADHHFVQAGFRALMLED